MGDTNIEWTDKTWNPIRGCSRISDGCRHCYAEAVAYRFSGPGQPYDGLVRIGSDGERKRQWNGQIKFVEKHLLDPLKWQKPARIFVNSMSDLFHESVTDEMRDKIFAVMAICWHHRFQILTKRAEQMLDYFTERDSHMAMTRSINNFTHYDKPVGPWPLPNVHLGVSCENQTTGDERIPLLLQTPAALRFISAEPLLGSLDISAYLGRHHCCPVCGWVPVEGMARYLEIHGDKAVCLVSKQRLPAKLDWVIAGGESGPGARPMHPDWARGLRDQCGSAGVPFFFKQWGEWMPVFHGINPSENDPKCRIHDGFTFPKTCDSDPVGQHMWRVGKKGAGAMLDGREWREFPGSVPE